jgi:phosphate starvation-inducible protein PhoH and related proteins
MSTKKNSRQAALFANNPEPAEKSYRDTPIARRMELIEGGNKAQQHQPAVNNSLKIKLDHLKTFEPLTENQIKFFNLYKTGCYFMGLFGSAGTGKTFCALYKALEEVLDKTNSFKRVVIVRSCVPTRDVGFLPGSLEEKQEVYEMPYKEICTTLFDRPDAYERLKEQGYIKFISTTAIRGISIDDSVILVDEFQNMNWSEANSVISRTGNRSKIIFCGDFKQTDLNHSKTDKTAFHDFVKVARSMREFSEIYFTTNDIVRSSLVKEWIIKCEEFGY